MKLGTENRKQMVAAAMLVVVLIAILVHEFMPSSSTIASTAPATAPQGWESQLAAPSSRPVPHRSASTTSGRKPQAGQSLDPTLHLTQLASAEQIQYEGSGRNIFVAQADVTIPTPVAPGSPDAPNASRIYTPPPVSAPPPIPLKFFGFASKPGEPKKIFLSKGDDVFIAGEGEVIDRRYKVVRILPNAVEIQDVVGSGPPQSIPLTQG